MLNLSITKIRKNKLIFLSLTIAAFLFITVSCMLPMFKDALVGRMLQISFATATKDNSSYSNLVKYNIPITKDSTLATNTDLIENKLINQYKQPVAYLNKYLYSSFFSITDITYGTATKSINNVRLVSGNNLENSIEIISGTMPTSANTEFIEIAISNETAKEKSMVLGRTYEVNSSLKLKLKVVGIYDSVYGGKSYFNKQNNVTDILLCNSDAFSSKITEESGALSFVSWNYYLDYTKLSDKDVPEILSVLKKQTSQFLHLQRISNESVFSYSAKELLSNYKSDTGSLDLMILLFTIPMFLLLLYCIFFLSKLIVEMDKAEIALLHSRGASIWQIANIYFMQSLVLVIIPLFISPFISIWFTKILGNTIGFLQFGKNIAIDAKISIWVLLFDIIASALVVFTILIPSLLKARVSVVKRKQVVNGYVPFWKKFYLDFILLLVSAYGYYNFMSRQEAISKLQVNTTELPLDPLTFLIMILFLTSISLMFLRIYPSIINMFSKMGKKSFGPTTYSALQRVSALGSKEQYIVFFIVATIALGIFSANSSLTINKNLDDVVSYAGGSDILINNVSSKEYSGTGVNVKPDIRMYTDIKGVKSATIVSTAVSPQIYFNNSPSSTGLQIKGIDTYNFKATTWEDPNKDGENMDYYLTVLKEDESGCIISQSLAKKLKIKVGDSIQVNANNKGFSSFNIKVKAIFKYWPTYTYNPDVETLEIDDLIITNSVCLEKKFGDVDYSVLLKTDNDVTAEYVRDEINKVKANILNITDNKVLLYQNRNSAQRQSINTLLTLSFLIIFIICFIGYLIYWILSIKSRILQIGILRAMGLSSKNIYSMLQLEQFLIAIIPCAFSLGLGWLISMLFSTVLEVSFGSNSQLIPFNFYASGGDLIKVIIFFAFMFITNLVINLIYIKKINVTQTLKLGED